MRPAEVNVAAKRVLVVDDEPGILTFADRALREGGYDVTLACDGPEALMIAARSRPFDLYILDVRMPRMHGDELARQIRLSNPEARVLYFTGYSDHLFTERAVLWEQEAFLEKPVTVKGLLEAVSLSLTGHTCGPDH